jgi:DNA polymerase I
MFQRLRNHIAYLDGAGPSLQNIERVDQCAVPMISAMRQHGMQVDLSHFARIDVELTREMEQLTEEVKVMTGHYCNLDSGDQVSELLFKKLKLKQARVKMTNSGDRESVEDEVLTAIQHDHPVVPKLLIYKELSKLCGTYVRPMPLLARRTKFGVWRMYPNLGHTRVPSGRLNCVRPNLLAMPTRTERGQEIRKGFITDPGWTYLSVDFSQIEVRVAAHRSKDKNLIAIYEDEQDIYYDFATAAFSKQDKRYKDKEGWHYPGVSKDDERRPAKTCVLAAIYDVTGLGLLEQMPVVCANCKLEATKHTCSKFRSLWQEGNCQDLINAFYVKYPDLLTMRKRDHRRALKYGYLWDDWGRILHCTAARSVLDWVVSAALREAANFPLQSSAQGLLKVSMGTVWEDIKPILEVCHPLLQVHDELIYETRLDVVQEIAELTKYRFESCVVLDVPIVASYSNADTWGDIKK